MIADIQQNECCKTGGDVKQYKAPHPVLVKHFYSAFQFFDMRFVCRDGDMPIHKSVLQDNLDWRLQDWHRWQSGNEINAREKYPIESIDVQDYSCDEIDILLEMLYGYHIPEPPQRGPFTPEAYDWRRLRRMTKDLGFSCLLPLIDEYLTINAPQVSSTTVTTSDSVTGIALNILSEERRISSSSHTGIGESNQVCSPEVDGEVTENDKTVSTNVGFDSELAKNEETENQSEASTSQTSVMTSNNMFTATVKTERTSPIKRVEPQSGKAEPVYVDLIDSDEEDEEERFLVEYKKFREKYKNRLDSIVDARAMKGYSKESATLAANLKKELERFSRLQTLIKSETPGKDVTKKVLDDVALAVEDEEDRLRRMSALSQTKNCTPFVDLSAYLNKRSHFEDEDSEDEQPLNKKPGPKCKTFHKTKAQTETSSTKDRARSGPLSWKTRLQSESTPKTLEKKETPSTRVHQTRNKSTTLLGMKHPDKNDKSYQREWHRAMSVS